MEQRSIVILLAEDNPAHARLVERSLASNRVLNKLMHVSDGEEAVAYLRRESPFNDPELSPRPDVVLLDLRLPKVDGLEVLRQIKTDPELMQLPVVVLSTSQSDIDVARAYQLHANSYVVKPLDFTALTQLIGDLGYYWLVWNRSPNRTLQD